MRSLFIMLKGVYKCDELIRFVLGGGMNTGITYVAYLLLLNRFGYQVAYSFAYLLGIILSYLYNSFFVFKAKITFLKIVTYPFVYLVQYLISLLLLYLLVMYLECPKLVAPILVTVLNFPVVFILSKYILRNR